MKKLLSVLLTVVMIAALFTATLTVNAADGDLEIDLSQVEGATATFGPHGYEGVYGLMVGYGKVFKLGSFDLSSYESVTFTYATDLGSTPMKEGMTHIGVIGIKSQAVTYGYVNTAFDETGNITYVDLEEIELHEGANWDKGERSTTAPLDTDYNGDVYLSVFNPTGDEILVTKVVLNAKAAPAESTDEESVTSDEEEPAVTERELETIEAGKLNIVIDGGTEKKIVKAGDEVEFKINVANNTGISSLGMTLTWSEKLTITSVKFDASSFVEDEEANIMTHPKLSEIEGNSVMFNWIAADSVVKAENFTFVTIKFKVADDVTPGEFLAVTAEINPDNVADEDLNNIEFKLINGGLDVEKEAESTDDVTTDDDTTTDTPTDPENPNNPRTADVAIIAVASVAVVALAGAFIGKKALKK